MTATAAPVALTELALQLLAEPNFATVATKNRDGTLQQSVVWVTERHGRILFSTVVGRAKERNILRDPEVSIVVVDRDNPYRYVAILGVAHTDQDGAAQLINELSQHYTGREWVESETRPRVNVVITPTRVTEYQW